MIAIRIMEDGEKLSVRAFVHIRRRATTGLGGQPFATLRSSPDFLWL
jgi:hypothetical protein